MKQLGFRRGIELRWKITKASILFGFKESLAYSLNNWGNLLSMIFYMVTFLIFLDVLFGRVKTVAGYEYSEMLFFTLIVQINYYLSSLLTLGSIGELDTSINTGELDLWLVKPVPILWYVSFRKVNLGELVFSALPATVPLLVVMSGKWSSIQISFAGFLAGLLCIVLGQVIIHCFQFIIAMTTFFTGEGKSAKNMALEISMFGDMVPFEGYPGWFRVIGFTVIPILVHSALSVSFFLGKSMNYAILIYVFVLTAIFLWLKVKAWNYALRNYSSASS